jgi:hypothetical protein
MKRHVAATIGILSERLPYDFAKDLEQEAAKEEDDTLRIGKELVESVEKAQRRLERTLSGDFKGERFKDASNTSNLASAPTSTSAMMSSNVEESSFPPSLMNRMKSDSNEINPEETSFEDLETRRRPIKNTLSGDVLHMRWPKETSQSGDMPVSNPKLGMMASLKGRAKLLLGLQDPTEQEEEGDVDKAEAQGNEVGGLAKEVILGSKDALGPGKTSKSKEEMQDLMEHAISVRKRLSAPLLKKREGPNGAEGYVQGHETPNNFPMEAVERKKQEEAEQMKKERGWFGRLFHRKSKL